MSPLQHCPLGPRESNTKELEGALYYIRYPLAEGGGHITVATTRPETMLGDTGVAVHPDDPRYHAYLGHKAVLPIIGREILVVADEAISPEFGTGALKVTPGHDPTDFEIGQRHDLPVVTVIGLDGTMTGEAGPYVGQERFHCRKGVVAQLEREGLLEKVEPHRHSVGHCQRCKTVVEPLVSVQWFMNVGRHDDPDSIAGRGLRGRCRRADPYSPREVLAAHISTGWRIFGTGASAASSGGATAYLCGTAMAAVD